MKIRGSPNFGCLVYWISIIGICYLGKLWDFHFLDFWIAGVWCVTNFVLFGLLGCWDFGFVIFWVCWIVGSNPAPP